MAIAVSAAASSLLSVCGRVKFPRDDLNVLPMGAMRRSIILLVTDELQCSLTVFRGGGSRGDIDLNVCEQVLEPVPYSWHSQQSSNFVEESSKANSSGGLKGLNGDVGYCLPTVCSVCGPRL